MPRPHAMYMHTLDGKPANVERIGRRAQLYWLGPRSVARLRTSIGEIRRDWNDCLETYERQHAPCAREAIYAELARYGYVLVAAVDGGGAG